jgi:predicted cobalt transporter CbtA
MVAGLLWRGMLAGFIAGLLAFGFSRVVGEPQIESAIAFEEQVAHGHGETSEPELVSRQTQAGLGLFTDMVVYGSAVGGLVSLIFAFVYGRGAPADARTTAVLLALGGFVAVVLVPSIKYPANPPAIGAPETIGLRTALYFAMLAISLAGAGLSASLARLLALRIGAWNGTLIAALTFAMIVAAASFALPDIDEVPDGFSAALLWRFRLASVGIHLVLWSVLGLSFGAMVKEEPRRKTQTGSFGGRP